MTIPFLGYANFVGLKGVTLKQIKVVALTHKKADLSTIGRFHIEEADLAQKLAEIKKVMGLSELMYLSTCNRVEIIFVSAADPDESFITKMLRGFLGNGTAADLESVKGQVEEYEGLSAVKHLFQVASSLDSMVVGEREIITQFRKAYELCSAAGLTGDHIRIAVTRAIEAAKRIFTETQLCTRPVSVVSLAFKALQDSHKKADPRVIVIGAGQTNRNLCRFLVKAGYRNLHIFNRTFENAVTLAAETGGKAYQLNELQNFNEGFDILITCTGSAGTLIDRGLYHNLVRGELSQKIVIDLAIPADFDPAIKDYFPVKLINVASLKPISEANIRAREKELILCEDIIHESLNKFRAHFRERKVELAMKKVPGMVKEIREKAVGQVFAREMQQLDPASREVLEKMLTYMEKKYISGPIKMAKEIMLSETPEQGS